MAIVKEVRGFSPSHGEDCWFADNAVLIGDVTMGDKCTVWFSAVVRGDVNFIRIGNNSNIQDNATIHGTYEQAGTTIGDNVTVGHNAIIHGCTLEDETLIGMGAIVMDKAVIRKGAIIAAGAVVLEGTVVEENTIFAGVPAKMVKKIDEKNRSMMKRIANNYIRYASWFQEDN